MTKPKTARDPHHRASPGQEATMRVPGMFVFIAVLQISAGCSGSPTPAAPSQVSLPSPTPPSRPPATPAETTAAQLVIEQQSMKVVYPAVNGYFQYELRFLLRETTGKSGATIENLLVGDGRGGGDNTGPACWRETLRVPPGGTLDTFYTEAGWKWLGYCGIFPNFRTENPPMLYVVVTFKDDDGRTGSITGAVSAN